MYSRVLKLSIMYSSLSRFSSVEMSQYLSNNVSRKMGCVYGRVLSGTAGRLNGICQQRSLTPAGSPRTMMLEMSCQVLIPVKTPSFDAVIVSLAPSCWSAQTGKGYSSPCTKMLSDIWLPWTPSTQKVRMFGMGKENGPRLWGFQMLTIESPLPVTSKRTGQVMGTCASEESAM